jgi:hypothetical protein
MLDACRLATDERPDEAVRYAPTEQPSMRMPVGMRICNDKSVHVFVPMVLVKDVPVLVPQIIGTKVAQ